MRSVDLSISVRIFGIILATAIVARCRMPDVSVPAGSQFVLVASEGSMAVYQHKRTGRCFVGRGSHGVIETGREVCEVPKDIEGAK